MSVLLKNCQKVIKYEFINLQQQVKVEIGGLFEVDSLSSYNRKGKSQHILQYGK
jgi:hypothetical protein